MQSNTDLSRTSAVEVIKHALPSLRNDVLIRGLAGYVEDAVLSETQAVTIRNAIAEGKNIIVTGSGGMTGKTTLCNVLVNEWGAAHPELRMLVVEQLREISSNAGNVIFQLEPEHTTATTWSEMIQANNPAALTFGELRCGAAVQTLLGFWRDVSRAGFSTVYAGSPATALSYLVSMLGDVGDQSGPELVAKTVDFIVHLEKPRPGVRICTELVAIDGYNHATKAFNLAPAV